MKVKIKSWEAMKKEFGVTSYGFIGLDSGGVFVEEMEEHLPSTRIIEVSPLNDAGDSRYMWKLNDDSWVISQDMIEYTIHEHEAGTWYDVVTDYLLFGDVTSTASLSHDIDNSIPPTPNLHLEDIETFKLRNTNLEVKQENFSEFMEKINSQLTYGATKYKPLNEAFPDKETTDYLVDLFPEFVESTVVKYMMRWRNQKREEDLIKIATYMYILWLKYFTGEDAEANRELSQNMRGKK